VHAALVAALLPGIVLAMDIEAFWEYGDPAASEARFRAALTQAAGDERLELLTQIARTYSLRRQFDAAHAQLNEIEPHLATAGAAPRVRYALERGRTYNSAGDATRASALFRQAWDTAAAAGLHGLAVDAAHMLAIVEPPAEAARWTERGLALARRSDDPKARGLLPALLNNHAWNLFDEGRPAEALPVFREAEDAWHATGRQPQGRIATWSVGRALRALQRFEDALALQRQLEREWQDAGGADGYVFEEIAENLEALGRAREATEYFGRAAAELGQDSAFERNEPARWQRIRSLAARTF
jgi:tetratricopeptide (TPR) repeat protein